MKPDIYTVLDTVQTKTVYMSCQVLEAWFELSKANL